LPASGSAQATEQLLEAAAQEFIERGYDGARVVDISRRAGVTTGAVYARWRDKNEMMVAALDHIFAQLLPNTRFDDSQSEAEPPDLILLLGAKLLEPNRQREVLAQVFGSARNNEAIGACLEQFINEEASQVAAIVENGREDGFVDPGLSTAAIALLCQAAALGIRLLILGGLQDHHVPSPSEWNELLVRLIGSVAPLETADS